MADTPLNNIPQRATLLSSVNALFAALRGDLVPRNAAGVVGDGVADLGIVGAAWRRIRAQYFEIGGVDVTANDILNAGATPGTAAQTAMDASGTTTQAHGLGAVPDAVVAYLECTTAQAPFAVGNRVPVGFIISNHPGIRVDANCISLRPSGAIPTIRNVESGAGFNVLRDRWKLVAVPYLN